MSFLEDTSWSQLSIPLETMNVRTQWGWWRLQYPTTALSAGSARHVVHLSAAGASTVRDFVQLHKPVTSWEYRATVSYTERSVNLWPRRCAGHTRCRCGWLRVQQWSQQTTHSLLAASWSQQTTHCWPPVDHDERRIVGVESFNLFDTQMKQTLTNRAV